jgi:glucose-6-phosphate 1-dehydrogenase
VETFAAMKLWVDNWRWAGVPFYLRSGKRLPKHSTEIVVHFKCPPLDIFDANERDPVGSNRLIFHIQPEEAISFQVRAKIPGPTIRTRGVKMDFNYNQFGDVSPTTGYEKLLYDCMLGDSTLFHSTAMVEAGWQVAQPILDGWANHPPTDFPNYAPGEWGPPAAQEMLSSGDDTWWVEPKPKS